MIKYKVVIIEDELKSMEVLKSLLQSFCPEVVVAGAADSVTKGVKLITEVKPDIVLLDIEMQSGTGFDLLQQLDETNFQVIFTTAYEHYAVKAIKFSALDYLLKPIDIGDLKEAVRKAIAARQATHNNRSLTELLNNLKVKTHRITISTTDDISYIDVDQILRCEAQGSYTVVLLKTGGKLLASKNLKEYELMLEDHDFFRVHHSHLINLNEVKRYIKGDGGMVEMKDGSKVGISQNKKEEFLERMKLF